jgi:hypothetical protein
MMTDAELVAAYVGGQREAPAAATARSWRRSSRLGRRAHGPAAQADRPSRRSCPTCAATKRRVGAFAIIGLAPAFALPDWVRPRVLAEAPLPSPDASRRPWRDDGFPPNSPATGSPGLSTARRRALAAVGAVAAVILLVVVLAIIRRGGGDGEVAHGPAPATAAATTAETSPASVAAAAPPTPVSSATTPVGTIDEPPDASDTTEPPPATPVDPPEVTDLVLVVPSETDPPFVEILRAPSNVACTSSAPPRVEAAVADASAIDEVVLSWAGPGVPGAAPMAERPPGRWSAPLGLPRLNGTWTYAVTATDQFGNAGEDSGTVAVTAC